MDGKLIASSGGVTRLYQIIDLVNAGYTPEQIKQWCEKHIAWQRANGVRGTSSVPSSA
jgi:hypothetical protein